MSDSEYEYEEKVELKAVKKPKKKYPKKIWIEKEDFEMLNNILDETYNNNRVKWFNLKLLYHLL